MKKTFFILFCILSIQCYSQIELAEITVYEDTTIFSKVQIVDFGKYKGFIFPKEYGSIIFSHPKDKRSCFDIDKPLILKVDKELISQYYSANKYFMERRFQEIYENEKMHPGSYDVKALNKDRKDYWKIFKKNKNKMEEYLESSDRQYIGYVSNKGEKIIRIQIVPHHYNYDDNFMRKRFAPIYTSQDGSDVMTMHYHLSANRITVNEDF
ncbi:hypothetical protein M2451_003298 [Dysgonomonas sp. PFB1-18]|uniref:hypothetical protein n=1 Tax=unclassified Dysgonomonas TaxID=2630389 RepID=UPI002476157A|nr:MULTISPECIES: hypothetical protein [unclassified Dysgonomonas]MDH6310412.1 hypothetical protein [Dysgonomonas sp. PF1-14]MDH6340258.1 hypothetical protein [Dysgonomonas sp. PF1-16]MDH6381961.1 hypothetical protein [Dysgonomonas sp. PFB1-18]MDH6399230.1 hypothetical protein [Dysgonomonas sp. PF1-23]